MISYQVIRKQQFQQWAFINTEQAVFRRVWRAVEVFFKQLAF